MKMHHFILFVLLAGVLVSCNEYRRVLKSTDMQYKYDKAIEYYKNGKFTKAYPLLEELYIVYRGTDKAERIAYYQANCDFEMKDYILAGHRYGQYYRNFPNSTFSEEAQFKSAYCSYLISPKWSLDQTDTYKAIRSLQLFAIDHPESSRIDSCNQLLDELRGKLEYKDYRAAKLFLRMENYQAAAVAFDIFNKNYPASQYREETNFLHFKSTYLLAMNSVDLKKLERIDDAMDTYVTFVDRFSNSENLRDAEEFYEKLKEERESLLNFS